MNKYFYCLFLFFVLMRVSYIQAQNTEPIYFNFGNADSGVSPWNNAGTTPVTGVKYEGLSDAAGSYSGISIELQTDWGGIYAQGATTGNDAGIVPDAVLQEYFWFGIYDAPEEAGFKVTGLTPGLTYTFQFVGSSVFHVSGITDNGNTIYRIGDDSVSLYVEGNTENYAQLTGITADADGVVEVVLSKDTNASVGYINALIIIPEEDQFPAPADFSATYTAGAHAELNWLDYNTDETGFEIYRAVFDSAFQLITTVDENVIRYVDTEVLEGYTYTYKIRSVRNSTVSGFAVPASLVAPVFTGNPLTVGAHVYVNFNDTQTASSPWNNTGGNATAAALVQNLIDDAGVSTGITLEMLSDWGGAWNEGGDTGNDGGIVPDVVLNEYYWFGTILNAPTQTRFRVKGLTPGQAYDLEFIGSSTFSAYGVTDNGHTVFTVGTYSDSLYVQNNTTQSVMLPGVKANVAGEIVVTMDLGADAEVGYINALVIGLPAEENTADSLQTVLNQWAFQYRYDARKRMSRKKVPGADWVYMVYDDRDRLVLTQDGNQRLDSSWTFTKYDGLNRVVITGIYNDGAGLTQEAMQSSVDAFYGGVEAGTITGAWSETFEGNDGAIEGYTNVSFPAEITIDDCLSITYYDTYDFAQNWADAFDYTNDALSQTVNGATYEQPTAPRTLMKGQVTGAQTRNLGSGEWLQSVSYYDERYRVIQVSQRNHRGGVDRLSNLYDFVGKVLKTKTTHTLDQVNEHTNDRQFVYDHAGRLLETWHQTDDQPEVLLAKNDYNEIGQLVTKKLYSEDGAEFKQVEDFRYNIRGWLTRINDTDLTPDNADDPRDLFGMNLYYEGLQTELQNTSLYNGNISAMTWSNNLGLGSVALAQPKARGYVFDYDTLNRLKAARQQIKVSNWAASADFHERDLTYDLNGNIRQLTRTDTAGLVLDALTYDYGSGLTRSNQLLAVNDAGESTRGFVDGSVVGQEYYYDANGNMLRDNNKRIAYIHYNLLNLPDSVVKTDGQYLKYWYDATGMKLRQEVYQADGTLQKASDYLGEYFYENDTLKFVNHEEGRIVMTGAAPEYQYHLKDHLGNVRLTFTTMAAVDSATATMETAQAANEQSEFLNYAQVQTINHRLFDHTNAGGTYNAVRLMGGNSSETYGLAKSLSVMPGDTLRMEVYAKYLDPNPDDWQDALKTVIEAIAGAGAAGTYIDGGGMGSIDGTFPFPDVLIRENDTGDGPKAYLNYLLFDRNMHFLTGGFKRVSTLAKESGTGTDTQEGIAHEHLYFDDIIINQPGYVYIYLSNENETPVEVFFDDFKVEHVHSPVVQQEDYYPFGLQFRSYSRENSVENRYKFNGKELIRDLALNDYDYGARQYDPAICRWKIQDRKAEYYFATSPYVYALNQPTNAIDPDGNLVIFINGNYYGSSSKQNYWQGTEHIKVGERYVGQRYGEMWYTPVYETRSISFDGRVMDQLDDHHSLYYDGSGGGGHPLGDLLSAFAQGRMVLGYAEGVNDAKEIINSLARDKNGNIVETIKIVTHSMGGAYGKGFVAALKTYIKTLPNEQQKQILISLVADFDPYQAGDLTADPDIKTQQFIHKNVWNLLGFGWLANDVEQGIENGDVHTNTGSSTDHSIFTFLNDVKNLEEGTYIWDGEKWIKQ